MKTAFLCAVAAIFAGCAAVPPIEQQTASQIAMRSTVMRDDFKKTTSVNGEKFGSYFNSGVNDFEAWLHANRKDGGATSYALAFKSTRGYAHGWAFWGEAYDSSGTRLPVLKIGTDVAGGGITYELVTVELTKDYIEAHRSGMTIRIDGQRAKQVVTVPANYIEGFLWKVSEAGL